MDKNSLARSALVLFLVLAVVVSVFPGVAAAETRAGGTVIVEEGETVDGLSAMAGTIIVRGTVDGNLEGVAGSVVIETSGVVTGDLSMSGGNIHVAGRVDGNAEVGSGSITIARGGEIGGTLRGGAGSVSIDGSVGGDAVIGAASITLGESGSVGGDLRYDEEATFVNRGGSVGGSIVADPNIGGETASLPEIPGWVFSGYAMLVNLVLGAVLLLVVPGFSERVNDTVAGEPLKSTGVGVAGLIGTPIALVILAITIVGIPLTIAGALLFGLLVWVALIYGRIAVGAWALKQVDVGNRWLALVVGVVGLGLIGQVPIVGGLVSLVTFLLGLGAIALVLVTLRRSGGDGEAPGADTPTGLDRDEAEEIPR